MGVSKRLSGLRFPHLTTSLSHLFALPEIPSTIPLTIAPSARTVRPSCASLRRAIEVDAQRHYDTRYYKGVPSRNGGDIVVYTGLSVTTACGHTITLHRDPSTNTAEVVVSATKGRSSVGVVDEDALTRAVEIFVARARRFLGMNWTVVSWDGEVVGDDALPAPEVQEEPARPMPTKVAGYISPSCHL